MKAKLVMFFMAVVLCSPRLCAGKRTAKDWGKVCPGATENFRRQWIRGYMDTAMDTAVVSVPAGY